MKSHQPRYAIRPQGREALGAFHFLTKIFSDATKGCGRTGPTRSNGAGPVDHKLYARPELARNP